MNRLADKIAFVTGAGGGIGRAICERFVAEGALVAAADIDIRSAELAAPRDSRNRVIALQCDVGDSDSVRRAISEAVATFGALHILCNVAGGSTLRDAAVVDAPEDEFWRAVRVDLFGTFACCKHGLPEIVRSGGGSVINMASMVSTMAVPGRDCYTAAKGGVVALTRSMAAEYAPQSVRVNAIAPGITLTPRVMARLDGSEARKGLAATHRLGLVDPLEVAHLAVYLGSNESRTMTGQVIAVDSGASI